MKKSYLSKPTEEPKTLSLHVCLYMSEERSEIVIKLLFIIEITSSQYLMVYNSSLKLIFTSVLIEKFKNDFYFLCSCKKLANFDWPLRANCSTQFNN